MTDADLLALRRLVEACEADCCSPGTEEGEGRCDDDESVACTSLPDGRVDDTHLTFGIIRQARAAITALSSPGERERELEAALRRAEKALNRAEDGAGSVKAKDAVLLRPADWHALGNAIRALSRTEAKTDAE